MVSIAAISIQDINGNNMLVDSSGNLKVNIITGAANVSGSEVFLGSGSIAGLSGFYSVISGAAVSVSGNTVITSISGNVISISGNVINISGSPVSVSGNVVFEQGRTIITAGALITTANSGGAALSTSAACFAINLRNASGNNPIWIGGSGNYPVSISGRVSGGVGYQLYPGDQLRVKIVTPALVFASAELSGDRLTWMAESF